MTKEKWHEEGRARVAAAAQTQKKMNKTNARSGKIVKSVQSERESLKCGQKGRERERGMKMYS